jgi:hypothetical protein
MKRSELPENARDLSDASLRLAIAESGYLGMDLGLYLTLFKGKIIFNPDPRIYPIHLSIGEELYYRLLSLWGGQKNGFSRQVISTVLEEVSKCPEQTLARKNRVQRNETVGRLIDKK